MSHAGLYMGIPLVVFPKFDLLLYLEALQREKVTYSHLVPPILIGLAKHPAVDKFDLSSLKFLMSGAAPLGPELAQAVAKRLNVTVLQGWGMTETSPVVHVVRDTKTPLGSCGELIPNCEARVVDPDTGKDVAKGERGELWVRGPMVMVGYHNNAQATADTIDKDMWLHTGDVVYVDKSGNFYVVDRIKELIKYKGFQVPPAELEAYLLEHPDIADAAVISRPCEVAGELPRAFVVCREGTKLTEKDVIGFIDGKVTNYKRLRGGVAFVSEIPKAASGKILRRVLRDQDKIAMEAEKASTASRL
ncbi:hypothetical protein HKX48_006386 [Thoreauomyces humboldtii]|nr:hypothetical protein HKX48_006386 [Thoreauomyces humboldtii]